VKPIFRSAIAAAALLAATVEVPPVLAEKSGGVLRMPMITSPASMSIHEESTIAALGPMMGVFNNLVMFDQHVPQNSFESIVPDLAPQLVLERGRQRTDLQIAVGRQVA
jgi:peptide/nickel transport system substrate-binding protein